MKVGKGDKQMSKCLAINYFTDIKDRRIKVQTICFKFNDLIDLKAVNGVKKGVDHT